MNDYDPQVDLEIDGNMVKNSLSTLDHKSTSFPGIHGNDLGRPPLNNNDELLEA
jgi:hypothetical protein